MAICFSTEGMIVILFDIKITSYFLSYSKSVKNATFFFLKKHFSN